MSILANKACFRRFLLCALICCSNSGCAIKSGKQVREEITSLYSAASPEFRQSAGSLLGPNFVSGNSITTLVNGDQIFPAMLSAIRSAKKSITFETYVFGMGRLRVNSRKPCPNGRAPV